MPERDKPGVKKQGLRGINSIRIAPRPEHLELATNKEQTPPQREEKPTRNVEGLQGVYIISVAARLLEMHPQTLRKYERLGLVRPSRTIGMLRLYSEEDLGKLRLIRHLEEYHGLNLAGVEFTLNMVSHLLDMFQRLSSVEATEQFFSVVEEEMAQLFERLNLPLQE